MNITVGNEDFLKILGRTQGVVDRRHSMAILTNLVINAGASEISVVATDLEVSLRQTIAAKVTEPGSVALSARKLFEIVRESTSPEVTVRSLDGHGVGAVAGPAGRATVGSPQRLGSRRCVGRPAVDSRGWHTRTTAAGDYAIEVTLDGTTRVTAIRVKS